MCKKKKMTERVQRGQLEIATCLFNLVEHEITPGLTGIDPSAFWLSFEAIVNDLMPKNEALLTKRQVLQDQIDVWHKEQVASKAPVTMDDYKIFLQSIGYLVPEGPAFTITTENVDAEIASVAAPQLIVPINNARYSLNAANARWGSLYDALYGTDAISEEDGCEKTTKGDSGGRGLNSKRVAKVIMSGRQVLDTAAPLTKGASHSEAVRYYVKDRSTLAVVLKDGSEVQLLSPSPSANGAELVGYLGSDHNNPSAVVVKHNGLHVEIQLDTSRHSSPSLSSSSASDMTVSSLDPAGIKDILMESAATCVQDCEDSVTAVDAEDKVEVYRNWLGLMKGTLEDSFEKGGKVVTRRLNPDRVYIAPASAPGPSTDSTEEQERREGQGRTQQEHVTLPGRALMLIRNVGHLMTSDAVLFKGEEVPEGILDCAVTALCSLHDLQRQKGDGDISVGSGAVNSRKGSMYIVKPKMHGPEEVAFAVELFSRVEQALSLPQNTLKIGIMDEERRTTVNLKECIRVASARLIFINTGFLDRTGDEMHTSMEAGPFQTKGVMKNMPWLQAYENWNVDIGLSCGLQGRAQIGKGMWAMPDKMAEMLEKKIAHLQQGANCSWVPSPTAATLHATHYHQVDVFEQQKKLFMRERASIDDILSIPLIQPLFTSSSAPQAATSPLSLSPEVIQNELNNNAQSMLGYVVRWIDQGIGCSKVPDVNNVGLMEDRATLRISSQHIANWLKHGMCTKEQVMETLHRMAAVVDQQNKHDPAYIPMLSSCADASGACGNNNDDSSSGGGGLLSNVAFQSACKLVFEGYTQPSGYTEPILHHNRRVWKEKQHKKKQLSLL